MDTNNLLWVLGHKIRLLDTDELYGMIEVTSPPHVPGPPPHFHKNEREFFFIIHGTLDVMSNSEWKRCGAGGFVELPPNTTHTFINNTETDVRLLVVGEASRQRSRIDYPLHQERNADIGERHWKDKPARALGPHDGMPDRPR